MRNPFYFLSIAAKGERRRKRNAKKNGTPIPHFCIFSVTWNCNLKCSGCYAANYPREDQLSGEEIRAVFRETNESGTYLYVIVGGEPLTVPNIADMMADEKEALFFLFTNGTLLNEETAEKIFRSGNIVPVISIEGDPGFTSRRRGFGIGEKTEEAMTLLRKIGQPFAFSVMITHANIGTVLTKDWLTMMKESGAVFGFMIDYIPFPGNLDGSLVLTQEDLSYKRNELERRKKDADLIFFNFPGEEYRNSGCLSAGFGFVHINANGYVEPCPFSHYAASNIRNASFLDILKSEFFTSLRGEFGNRKHEYDHCLLFANDDRVRELAAGTSASRTDGW